MHMPRPSQSRLFEQSGEVDQLSGFQYPFIRHFIILYYAQDVSKTAHAVCIQPALLFCVLCPGFYSYIQDVYWDYYLGYSDQVFTIVDSCTEPSEYGRHFYGR